MRASFRWSNGEIEEIDVPGHLEKEYLHICSQQRLDPENLPVVSLRVEDCIPEIPREAGVPRRMQANWELLWKTPTTRQQDFFTARDTWFAWQRVIMALGSLDLSVHDWWRALNAAAEIPPPYFATVMSKGQASKGPGNLKIKNRLEVESRIKPELLAGERNKRKLKIAYLKSVRDEIKRLKRLNDDREVGEPERELPKELGDAAISSALEAILNDWTDSFSP